MRLMQRAGAAVLCFLPCAIAAQAPEPKPDSPAVRALIDRAKAVAGATWAEEVHFFCEAPRASRPSVSTRRK